MTEFPSGICVKAETGHWYINGRIRHKIKNKRVLTSWSFPFIVEATEASLGKFLRGKPLGFRDGTLVRDTSDRKIYLISARKRRLITSPEAYELLGLKKRKPIWVSHDEVLLHEEGEVIS